MLLDGERARIDRNTEDLLVGQESGPSSADGEGEQLGNDLCVYVNKGRLLSRRGMGTYTSNGNGRITEEEKLVKSLLPSGSGWYYCSRGQRTGMRMAHIKPIVQDRRVDTGISGSSVFATAERTSG